MIDFEVMHRLQNTLIERKKTANTQASYTASLFAGGENKIGKKIAEEAAELIMAAKDQDRQHIVHEMTDLWFHCLVLATHFDVGIDDIITEFRRREGISGIEEKQSRTGDRS